MTIASKHSTLKTQWSEPIDATEIQPIPPQPDNKLEDFLLTIYNFY